jgi:hypothetical protein
LVLASTFALLLLAVNKIIFDVDIKNTSTALYQLNLDFFAKFIFNSVYEGIRKTLVAS